MTTMTVLRRLLQTCKIRPTAEDKGLKLEIPVILYDNGKIYVAASPMMGSSNEVQICNAVETLTGILKTACEARDERLAQQPDTSRAA